LQYLLQQQTGQQSEERKAERDRLAREQQEQDLIRRYISQQGLGQLSEANVTPGEFAEAAPFATFGGPGRLQDLMVQGQSRADQAHVPTTAPLRGLGGAPEGFAEPPPAMPFARTSVADQAPEVEQGRRIEEILGRGERQRQFAPPRPPTPRTGTPKNFSAEVNRALDTVRENLGIRGRLQPMDKNGIITAAGLVSKALGRELTPEEFETIKRLGSQSIHGVRG